MSIITSTQIGHLGLSKTLFVTFTVNCEILLTSTGIAYKFFALTTLADYSIRKCFTFPSP